MDAFPAQPAGGAGAVKVSAVLLTHNEEINIDRCLRSLAWCDDIVVIDSGSTDRTIEICEGHGARVLHNPWTNFSTQRNFALANGALRHEWVLHLDADEEATPAFTAALAALEPAPGIFGYRVPSKTMLFGKWLRRSGMYPTYQVRLGHRDRCTFYEYGHGQRENLPPAEVGMFDEPYNHFAFSHGLRKWFVKHVGYAAAEADEIIRQRAAADTTAEAGAADTTSRRRAMKQAANGLPPLARPFAKFFYMAILRRGLLDGRAGIYYCTMSAIYEGMIGMFLTEKRLASKGIKP